MAQEFIRPRVPTGANHNWSLIRRIVELLRKSSVGLTPSTLLELVEEEGSGQDEVSRRGTYQRVLRALQQLESMNLVQRTGRRYILQVDAIDAELLHQAREAVQRLIDIPYLPGDPTEIQQALLQALQERTLAN